MTAAREVEPAGIESATSCLQSRRSMLRPTAGRHQFRSANTGWGWPAAGSCCFALPRRFQRERLDQVSGKQLSRCRARPRL